MVKGVSIRIIMDYVSKKRGIEGLNLLLEEVNRKRVLFMKESDIRPNENYPGYYLARVLDAAIKVLSDEEEIQDMGESFGDEMDVSFKSFLGRYPPRKSLQVMVIAFRKYLPIFHTGYRSITKKTYWLGISKMKEEHKPFIDGVAKSIFKKHGGIQEIKKSAGPGKLEYVLKF